MSEITQHAIFAREFQRRVDELINWAVENSSDSSRKLMREDFTEARQIICNLAAGDGILKHIEPEPEQGGPQYINDNPAPWP